MPVANAYPPSPRPVRILAVQTGPGVLDKAQNIAAMIRLLDDGVARHGRPDFVVFPELATTPYFCGSGDKQFLYWSEPVPGPTTEVFTAKAREHGCHIILPMFEQGPLAAEFYNAAVVIDRHGQILSGLLPDGSRVPAFRKCHVQNLLTNDDGSPGGNEQYYFRPGPGLAVFDTDVGRIGCLICYDRSFPECWRVLSLNGAEIVFVPVASWRGGRTETFTFELQTAALQNNVFAVAVNKGGLETCLEGPRHFFGSSCVISPMGEVAAQGPLRQGPALIWAEIDLGDRERYALRYNFVRDRRPDLYQTLVRAVNSPIR